MKFHIKGNGKLFSAFEPHVKVKVIKKKPTGGKAKVLNKSIKSKVQWDCEESHKLAISLDITDKIALARGL